MEEGSGDVALLFRKPKGLLYFVEENDVDGLQRELHSNRFSLQRLRNERREGMTALHLAAELDHVDILKVLIKAGGDCNVESSDECGCQTPLHCAAAGSPMCTEVLINCGADLNAQNAAGETPEAVATRCGQVACLTLIQRHTRRMKALKRKLFEVTSAEEFRALFDKYRPSEVKAMAMANPEFLFRTCAQGQIKVAKWLITHGISTVQEVEGAETVLHAACKTPDTNRKQYGMVQMLLEYDPKLLLLAGPERNTALHYAAAAGNHEIVYLLLECCKAIVLHCNDVDSGKVATKMIKRVVAEHSTVDEYLDINVARDDGRTPLHLASSAKHENVVKTLLDFSLQMCRMLETEISQDDLKSFICDCLMIDFSLHDCAQQTVLLETAASNNHTVLDLLFDISPNVTDGVCKPCHDPTDWNNRPYGLLTTAVHCGHLATINVLLKHNQYVDMTSALNEAFAQKSEGIIGLLLLKLVEVHSTMETEEHDEINWQGRNLPYVTQQWIFEAADLLACLKGMQVHVPVNSVHPSLSQVTHINLSQNQLTSVPIEVFLMTEVTTLNLASNKLTVLFDPKLLSSAGVSSLSSQTEGETVQWRMPELPCQKLQKLIISKNRLTALPQQLFELPHLKTLDALGNSINELPDNFWMSSSLEEVILAKNELKQLPGPHGDYITGPVTPQAQSPPLAQKRKSNVCQLGSLSSRSSVEENERKPVRYVKSDRVKKKSPNSIDRQCSLTKMSPLVHVPSLEESGEIEDGVLPDDVFSPGGVSPDAASSIEFSPSGIEFSPAQSRRRMSTHSLSVKSLASHHLSAAKGTPALIIGNEQQSPLDVVRNSSHPPRFGAYNYTLVSESIDETDGNSESETQLKASSLTELNLSHNKLKSLPLGFPCLAPNLRKLNVSFNKFEELDPVAMLPPYVEHLIANSNSIVTTSCRRRATDYCCAKVTVSLGGNSMCVHQRHDTLTNLRFLRMNNNQLVELELVQAKKQPIEGVDACETVVLYPGLHTLDISKNKLRSFPPKIAHLKGLRSLDVSYNTNIKKLSPDLIHLDELFMLPLNGLDLVDFPQTEMNQGAKRVVAFLRHRQVGKQFYRRMKLMVVGLAEKGKTTLVHRLVHHDVLTRLFAGSGLRAKTSPATVGIDISEMVLKAGKGKYSKAEPITFGIWDFAGHEEYYATHQCFLTKRSIYLVLWNLMDGAEGLEELGCWLSNIQARAPGSPVLIVGTHLDVVRRRADATQYLQMLVGELEGRYILNQPHGAPNVVGHFEVALVHRLLNVDKLRDKLFEVASEMKYGSGFRMDKSEAKPILEQSVPSSYLWLDGTVAQLKAGWNKRDRPPVIDTQEFLNILKAKVDGGEGGIGAKRLTENKEELNHATQFLHNNGRLLNYSDPLLRNLYFIDPQWLCKMAAKVVGLKEANPCTKNGVLDISNLEQLFRGGEFPSHLCNEYIALLEKFEVALRIEGNRLLIPSVLPATAEDAICLSCDSLSLSGSVAPSPASDTPSDYEASLRSFLVVDPDRFMQPRKPSVKSQYKKDRHGVVSSSPLLTHGQSLAAGYPVTSSADSGIRLPRRLHRIYLVPFHPSGFWPRLVSRMLTDKSIERTITRLITDSGVPVKSDAIQWSCWRSGVCMKICGFVVLALEGYPIAELRHRWRDKVFEDEEVEKGPTPSSISIQIDGKDTKVETFGGCCLEIAVSPLILAKVVKSQRPVAHVAREHSSSNASQLVDIEVHKEIGRSPPTLRRQLGRQVSLDVQSSPVKINRPDQLTLLGRPSYKRMTSVVQRTARENAAKIELVSQMATFLLSKGAYHIDTLLEDWYEGLQPDNSLHGDSIVKRIIPCFSCIGEANKRESVFNPSSDVLSPIDQSEMFLSEDYFSRLRPPKQVPLLASTDGLRYHFEKRVSQSIAEWQIVEIPKSHSDFGFTLSVSHEPENSSMIRYVSLSSCIAHVYKDQLAAKDPQAAPECLQPVLCPLHADVTVSLLAPDVEFKDLPSLLRVNHSQIMRGKLLGEGGYGSVFQGCLTGTGVKRRSVAHDHRDDIAIKVFDQTLKQRPDVEDDAEKANLLYNTVRAEVSIMLALNHPHVLPLCGVCINPLMMLTPLAPGKDLQCIVEEYRKASCQILQHTLREVLIQVARGMEHIHKRNIIYRDLRVDNVLVWNFPPVGSDDHSLVSVKVADYGISRFVSSFGIRPGRIDGNYHYLAPEIVQYGGKEAYSQESDIFCYGLLIYQLLTLQRPFHNVGAGISGKYLKGERPRVPVRCRRNFFSVHFLKHWCWAQDPTQRPQFSQVLSVLESDLFLRLVHHVRLTRKLTIVTGCAVISRREGKGSSDEDDCDADEWCLEVWTSNGIGQLSIVSYYDKKTKVVVALECPPSRAQTMCTVGDTVWVGTEQHGLFIFSVLSRKQLQRWPVFGGEDEDKICPEMPTCHAILAITHVKDLNCVLVSRDDGLLVVFDNANEVMSGKLSLVKEHDLADSIGLIHCMTVTHHADGVIDVWAGADRGQIAILDAKSLVSDGEPRLVKDTVSTCDQQTLGAGDFIKCLVTGECGSEHDDGIKQYMWCGLHRSQVVYQWNATSHQNVGEVDCHSALRKKNVSDRDSRVTSMLFHAGYLFIGTGGGYVVVVDVPILQILTTLLPHSGAVRCLIPFQPALDKQVSFLSSHQAFKPDESLNDSEPGSPNTTLDGVPNCPLRQIRRAAVLSCGLGLYGLNKEDRARYPPELIPVDEDEGHMLMWLADNWRTPNVC